MIGAIWVLLAGATFAGPQRDAVMTMLNAYETPIDAAAVGALGDGAAAELVAISNDETVPPTRRARAITALQHVEVTDEVVTTLRSHLNGDEALLQRHAALSLAAAGKVAIDDLTLALASPDTNLRTAAAEALGRIGTRRARNALEERLAAESDDYVKSALAKALETP